MKKYISFCKNKIVNPKKKMKENRISKLNNNIKKI